MNLRGIVFKGALILALLLLSSCGAKADSGAILLGGDVMLSRGGVPIFQSGDKEVQPWGLLETTLAGEKDALFMVNLESPLGMFPDGLNKNQAKMNLCADPAEIRILREGGIDLVTRANNHAVDCQAAEDLSKTQQLAKEGIKTAEADGSFKFFEWQGKTVAILALDDISKSLIAADYTDQIADARGRSDLVVISIHWGSEYQAGPSDRQIQLASELTNAGADLIWGHHPHVLQKMEWLTSTNDGHPALVMYSLGNLLADQWALPRTQITALVRVEFSHHKITGVKLIPLRMKLPTRQLSFIREDKGRTWISDRLQLEEMERPGVRVNLRKQ